MNQAQSPSGNSAAPSPLSTTANSRIAITSLPAILQQAVVLGASDVHFTPSAGEVMLRFRIGLELRDMGVLSSSQFTTIDRATRQYAGISILSNQQVEGHFELVVGDKKIGVNVSVMPTVNGDNILLQLQTEGQINSPLARLGMSQQEQDIVSDFLSRGRGLLVVIGPPKSGKTTTLYSIISTIDTKQTPVTTLELDVKSKLIGVSQNKVNVDKGSSIGEGLKVLVAQGKQTIMLSQITDGTTVTTALDATTSDHQILAGMFTSSIGETVGFMRGFKAQPFQIASNLLVVVNQRLLRLLCPFCKQPYTPNAEEIGFLRQNFDLDTAVKNSPQIDAFKTYEPANPEQTPPPAPQPVAQQAPAPAPADEPPPQSYPSAQPTDPNRAHALDRLVIPAPPASSLVGHSILERISEDPAVLNRSINEPTAPPAPEPQPLPEEQLSQTPTPQVVVSQPGEPVVKIPPINYIINHLKLYRATGCEHCQNTGYIGVSAIFEVMQMNEKIGEAILGGGDSLKIQQAAESSGMTSLRMAAIKKILLGDTSVEEVSRILSLLSQGVGILT